MQFLTIIKSVYRQHRRLVVVVLHTKYAFFIVLEKKLVALFCVVDNWKIIAKYRIIFYQLMGREFFLFNSIFHAYNLFLIS